MNNGHPPEGTHFTSDRAGYFRHSVGSGLGGEIVSECKTCGTHLRPIGNYNSWQMSELTRQEMEHSDRCSRISTETESV